MKEALLQNSSYILLLGSFGISIVLCLRNAQSLHTAFEKLIVSYFIILFYIPLLAQMFSLGKELEEFCGRLGSHEEINIFIAKSLYGAATTFDNSKTGGSTANLLNYVSQIFRTGVWGILASITELIFALAHFLLEVGRDALWEVLSVLLPLAAGLFPIAPKIFLGMFLFALELIFWLPILAIIDIATSAVARRYSTITSDIGFYVLALEIVAICLTFAVPSIAHKLISGALSGNILETWKNTARLGLNFLGVPYIPISVKSGASLVKKVGLKSILVFFVLSALLPNESMAKDSITLHLGLLKKIACEGNLYVSAIGDERIVELEAMPANVDCAVILKPLSSGRTNLILETSTKSLEYEILVIGTAKKRGSK